MSATGSMQMTSLNGTEGTHHERGGDASGGPAALRAVEEDVRSLMQRLGESHGKLAERDREHREEIERLLLRVIDVLDSFGRVFRNIESKADLITPQMKIWVGNFRAVRRVLEQVLAEKSITPINNLQNGFDPHWHTAAEAVVDASRPDGAVVEQLAQGYLWGDRILRKSQVVVVRHEESKATRTGAGR